MKIQNKVTGLHFIKGALFLCASTKTRDVEKNWSEEYFFPLGKILNYQMNRLDVYFQSMQFQDSETDHFQGQTKAFQYVLSPTETPCNPIFICQITKTVSYDIPSDQF